MLNLQFKDRENGTKEVRKTESLKLSFSISGFSSSLYAKINLMRYLYSIIIVYYDNFKNLSGKRTMKKDKKANDD